jgi:hypothetical protein
MALTHKGILASDLGYALTLCRLAAEQLPPVIREALSECPD